MEQHQTPLEKILTLLGIFRLERMDWPKHAAELQDFAVGLGKPLDFSNYHRFRFVPKSSLELTLDFCLLSLNEWTLGGQAQVKIKDGVTTVGHTLPLEVRIQSLTPQRMEPKSFCLLEEPAFSGKKSA